MTDGSFTAAARAAILTSTLDRCAGCGSAWRLEVHHRRPRGMGGTTNALIGEPWNGLGLCEPCHVWAESHRATAYALGWLTTDPSPTTPYWTVAWGWVAWVLLDDPPPAWCITPIVVTDPARLAAVTTYKARRRAR